MKAIFHERQIWRPRRRRRQFICLSSACNSISSIDLYLVGRQSIE